jgi:hypothetical protein
MAQTKNKQEFVIYKNVLNKNWFLSKSKIWNFFWKKFWKFYKVIVWLNKIFVGCSWVLLGTVGYNQVERGFVYRARPTLGPLLKLRSILGVALDCTGFVKTYLSFISWPRFEKCAAELQKCTCCYKMYSTLQNVFNELNSAELFWEFELASTSAARPM